MGYNTLYTFEIHPADKTESILDAIEHISGYSFREDDNESVKWYSHKEDMKKISHDFYDVKITITGAGEESGDLWVMYCYHGNIEKVMADITYKPTTLWE